MRYNNETRIYGFGKHAPMAGEKTAVAVWCVLVDLRSRAVVKRPWSMPSSEAGQNYPRLSLAHVLRSPMEADLDLEDA